MAGFSLLFALAGAGAGVLGAQFLDHRRGLELVGGAVVIAMGVLMLMPAASLIARALEAAGASAQPHGPLGQRVPAPPSASAGRPASAHSWRPSWRSPAAMAGPADGALLLFVYGLGLGVPFLAAGVWLPRVMSATRVLRDHWDAGDARVGCRADRGRGAAGKRPPDRHHHAAGRIACSA